MRALSFFLLFLLLPAGASPQAQPAAPKPETPVFRSGALEVVLDLVVRDKRGRAVKDLKPEEIEVIEEGTPQKPSAFRLVEGRDISTVTETASAPGAAPAYRRPADPLRQVRMISLVFERLDVEGRNFFKQAALDLLNSAREPNEYFALFTIDQRLHLLQPYTTERAAVKKALDRAMTGAYSQFNQDTQESLDRVKQRLQQLGSQDQVAPGAPGGGNNQSIGTSEVERKMAEMELNMLQMSDAMTRDQASRSSIFSLLALVQDQSRLPGRKMVFYFTEGLQVPVNLVEQFRSLVSAANRANVAFYTVDARGLTTTAQRLAGSNEIARAAQASRDQMTTLARGQQAAVTPEQAKVFDTIESGLRANTQGTLNDMAQSTGGFLISDTNDMRGPIRRAVEELRTYYEFAYTPRITEFNGQFRKISVKVNRPGLTVQARNGYFALPPATGNVFPYELPLLAAVQQTPLPRTIEYRAAAHRFGRHRDGIRYGLTLEIPLAGITLQPDSAAQTFLLHASMLALIKNARGEVVQKFSRDLPFQGSLNGLEERRKSSVILTFLLDLASGRYTLETAVADRLANQVSARRAALVVPAVGDGLALSHVALIRRIDRQPAADLDDPFQFTGGKVTPTLFDTVAKGPNLSFYLVIYPAANRAEKPELAVQFYREGQLVGQGAPPLPAPDPDGKIPYVADIPTASFPPGQYEIRFIARQGTLAAAQQTVLTIQ